MEAAQRLEEIGLPEEELVGRSELAEEHVVLVSMQFAEEDHRDWHMLPSP